MRAPNFTPDEDSYIADHYQTQSDREMAKALGRNLGSLINRRKKLGLMRWRPGRWTAEQEQYLEQHYADTQTVVCAAAVDKTVTAVLNKAHHMKLKKSDAFIKKLQAKAAAAGVNEQFKNGHVPWNKGKKIQSAEGSKATQFKKGHKPGNTRKKYHTRICSKDGYILIKLADKHWVAKHRLVWQRLNGPIPKTHILTFRDGNKLNLAITNLELITKAENARRNNIWVNYPRELAEAMQLQGKIKRKLNRMNEANHGQQ